jgi:hypothetical protein
MKPQTQLRKAVFMVFLLPYFSGDGGAQQPTQRQDSSSLSAPVHAALFPEVMCVHCILPEWERGYILHHEIERNADPEHPMVTMFDRNGKRVLEGRIWAPDFTSVSVITSGATHAGEILAGAGGIMSNGSIEGFIAKTDLSGRTVQSVRTGQFILRQVCEATDGTVWALGYDRENRESHDSNVLHHYSFERGLVGSFLPMDLISSASDGYLAIAAPTKSYLRCGKDRVSVYLVPTADYIEVDVSTEKLVRWKVGPSSVTGGKATGFAVTEGGRIFVSFDDSSCSPCPKRTHALYELRHGAEFSVANLEPIGGTLSVYAVNDVPPEGTFYRLWGADGDQLVVHRQGDGWGISWVSITTSQVSPD